MATIMSWLSDIPVPITAVCVVVVMRLFCEKGSSRSGEWTPTTREPKPPKLPRAKAWYKD